MDFSSVVELARRLHVDGCTADGVPTCEEVAVDSVYGRICSSESRDRPPTQLTATPGRKTAFVFGPDAISSVVLRSDSYQAVRSLGFTKEYIKHESMTFHTETRKGVKLNYRFRGRKKLIEKNCPYWLVLFKPSVAQEKVIVQATWEGVTHFVHSLYPRAYHDLTEHLDSLRSTPFRNFEKEAGFQFLECRRNERGTFPGKPPYHSYDFYCSLPQPRTALQVRLFLYCELRLLEMFTGDGYASCPEPGSVHSLEYLSPNLQLSDFHQLAVLPMTHVSIPD